MSLRIILKTILRFFNLVFKILADFFYPPFCISCDSILEKDERLLCEKCWHQIPQIHKDFSVDEFKFKLREKPFFSRAISIWEFDPVIQNVIHHLKYQNFKILAQKIGAFMAEKVKNLPLPREKLILIPVPLHKTRIRERGYNQSALLCQVIADETGIEYSDQVFQRIRYTQSQTKLNASERAKNVRDAFRVFSTSKIKNKVVILVDDVITTGSTMNACAKELILNGAVEVYLLSAVKA